LARPLNQKKEGLAPWCKRQHPGQKKCQTGLGCYHRKSPKKQKGDTKNSKGTLKHTETRVRGGVRTKDSGGKNKGTSKTGGGPEKN